MFNESKSRIPGWLSHSSVQNSWRLGRSGALHGAEHPRRRVAAAVPHAPARAATSADGAAIRPAAPPTFKNENKGSVLRYV